jgi:glycosyltransferase involved in cell wall biosynthesis
MLNLKRITRGLVQGFENSKKRDNVNLPTICYVNNPNIVVSFVINYYSKQSTIFSVVETILSQSLHSCTPEEIEIIIIDDGTQGESMCQDLPPRVIYLWQRKLGEIPYGICRAKNTGAKIANGKYLVFLDADITVSETYVEAALRGFQKYGERVVQCAYIHDYFFKGCPDPRTQYGVWENPARLNRRFFQVAGGSMAMSKDLFVESKGFNEDLIYGEVEDILFGYQLSRLPRTAMYFNREMECRHIPHPPSLAHADPERSWQIVKAMYPEFYDQYIVQGLR